MSVWTALWVLWGLMFAAVEGVAIFNDQRHDTLSEHFRKWFSTKTKPGRTSWIVVSGVFFAWFVTHIAVAGSM